MNKDRLEIELKFIMEEETKNIQLSQEVKEQILKYRKKSLKEKIKELLNKEVEIPLVPMVAVFTVILLIIAVPRDIFIKENINIVNVGSSQIIIRDERRIDKND